MKWDINVIDHSNGLKNERWHVYLYHGYSALASPYPVNAFVSQEQSLELYKDWLKDKVSSCNWEVTEELDRMLRIYRKYKRLDIVVPRDFIPHGKTVAAFLTRFLDTYGEEGI